MTKQERLERVRAAGDEQREALLDVWNNQDWLPHYVNLAQYLQAELGYNKTHAYNLQQWMSDLSDVSESSAPAEQSDKPDTEYQARRARQVASQALVERDIEYPAPEIPTTEELQERQRKIDVALGQPEDGEFEDCSHCGGTGRVRKPTRLEVVR